MYTRIFEHKYPWTPVVIYTLIVVHKYLNTEYRCTLIIMYTNIHVHQYPWNTKFYVHHMVNALWFVKKIDKPT